MSIIAPHGERMAIDLVYWRNPVIYSSYDLELGPRQQEPVGGRKGLV
jgi:hypothetical protein